LLRDSFFTINASLQRSSPIEKLCFQNTVDTMSQQNIAATSDMANKVSRNILLVALSITVHKLSCTVSWACTLKAGSLGLVSGGVILKAWKKVLASCLDSCLVFDGWVQGHSSCVVLPMTPTSADSLQKQLHDLQHEQGEIGARRPLVTLW